MVARILAVAFWAMLFTVGMSAGEIAVRRPLHIRLPIVPLLHDYRQFFVVFAILLVLAGFIAQGLEKTSVSIEIMLEALADKIDGIDWSLTVLWAIVIAWFAFDILGIFFEIYFLERNRFDFGIELILFCTATSFFGLLFSAANYIYRTYGTPAGLVEFWLGRDYSL